MESQQQSGVNSINLAGCGKPFLHLESTRKVVDFLSACVEELECRLGAYSCKEPSPFAKEEAEHVAYRKELDKLRDYVAKGEGI
jgi:hypothetical protein